LWMATWDISTTRVYTVGRPAGPATLRAAWGGGAYDYASPVVQTAVLGTSMYLLCTGYAYFELGLPYPERYVRWMSPSTYATAIVHTVDPTTASYAGGMAVTPGGTLVMSDGTYAYYSTDGVSWSFDADLDIGFDTADSFGALADPVSGRIFLADSGTASLEKIALRRDGAGSWAQDGVGSSPSGQNAGASLCSAAGVIWLQTQGWYDNPMVYWRAGAGSWVFDWDGPCSATGYTDEWLGTYSQGIVGFKNTVYGLWMKYWGGARTELFRRVSAGVWRPVSHTSWSGYVSANTLLGGTLGMCVVP
jgi:hypothetical protein